MCNVKIYSFSINTSNTFANINSQIKDCLKKSKIKEGIVHVFTQHTTAAIRIIEEERFLIEDLEHYLERTAPSQVYYKHDNIEARDVPDHERINAYSHLRSFFSNTSETIPVSDGKLLLGKWQTIMFIDFDKGRRRTFKVMCLGNLYDKKKSK